MQSDKWLWYPLWYPLTEPMYTWTKAPDLIRTITVHLKNHWLQEQKAKIRLHRCAARSGLHYSYDGKQKDSSHGIAQARLAKYNWEVGVLQKWLCEQKRPSRGHLSLALWVKFSADYILKYFSQFSLKSGFDISCKLSPMETICMKCQILFSGKNKKNVINLSSVELAKTVVKVKEQFFHQKSRITFSSFSWINILIPSLQKYRRPYFP